MKDEKKEGLTYWGCPSCGSSDVVHHFTVPASRAGKFRMVKGSRRGWEFDRFVHTETAADTDDVHEDLHYECEDCGEEFDEPALVRKEPGVRLQVTIKVEAFGRDEKTGVEDDLDGISKTRTVELLVPDEQKAKVMAEGFEQALAMAVELVKSGASGK